MSYDKIIRAVFLLPLVIVSIKANPDISKSVKNVSDKDREQLTQISLIAVGSKPPRRYEKAVNGNAPRMLLPTSEETPPSQLYYKDKESTELKPNWKSLRVSFNTSANLMAVAPERALQLYRKNTDGGEYEKYVNIPAGAIDSKRVCFLLPQKSWLKRPSCKMFDLGETSIKGKHFVFINLSQEKVEQVFDSVVAELDSMNHVAYEKSDRDKFFRLAARYGVDNKLIFNTAVKRSTQNQINWFIFYDVNPLTGSGRSIGVFRMMMSESLE